MAWRAIQDTVGRSVSLAALSDLAERLYWRFLGNSDPWGRLDGHPAKVRAQCFPMLYQVTDAAAGVALRELADVHRIQVYEHDGKAYIQILDFEQNQPGEVYRKRRPSKLPDPPAGPDTEPELIERLWNVPNPVDSGPGPEKTGTPANEHLSRNVRETSGPEESRGEGEREREVHRSSSVVAREAAQQALDDDEILKALDHLAPSPEQRSRWQNALHTEPDRLRASLAAALARGTNAAAYLDELVRNGSWPEQPRPAANGTTAKPPRHCPECGPISLPQGVTLADHRRNLHGVDDDDPEPAVSTTTTGDETDDPRAREPDPGPRL